MKKTFTLFFVLAMITTAINAQWVTQISNSGSELRSIYFTKSATGFAVGSGGGMVKTIDAGANWAVWNSGTIDTLRSIYFTDTLIGYYVGANGTIGKTTDGGDSFTLLSSGVTNLIRSVYFPTADTGYVCGGGGVILKTVDAGANWVLQNSGTTQDLINIRFATSDIGFAVSSLGTFASGLILRTIDGGTTWDTVYTDTRGLLALAVPSANTIFAGGNGEVIVRSTDGGNTWDTTLYTGSVNNLRNASFVSDSVGYIVGDVGLIYFTNDKGTTWTNQGAQPQGCLGIHCYNKDTVYVAGNAGIILRYTTPCTAATPTSIFGTDTMCSNNTFTYYINPVFGATSYSWTVPVGSTILSGQGDTLITVLIGPNPGPVTVSSVNNCGPSFPASLNLVISQSPTVPNIIQTGQALTSTIGSGNQWYLNGVLIPGATSQVYQPTQSGSYTVAVLSGNGCSSVSTPFYFSGTGLIESAAFGNITLAPQPVKDFALLNLQLQKATSLTINIFDLTGKKIQSQTQLYSSGIQTIRINCELFNQGIYMLQLKTNSSSQWLKLVKE